MRFKVLFLCSGFYVHVSLRGVRFDIFELSLPLMCHVSIFTN